MEEEAKRLTVVRLLEAKKQSEKSFTEIARATGLTNAYVAQLFHRQAQLTPSVAPSLSQAVPSLTESDIEAMMLPPRRSFDANLIQDPCIYRFHEAIMHYGESLRAIINEEFGDGIMSGIDFYCNLEKVKGKHGEDRVAVVFNGKFLPYLEQKSEDTVTTLP